jgi:hypothetical protein
MYLRDNSKIAYERKLSLYTGNSRVPANLTVCKGLMAALGRVILYDGFHTKAP